MKEDVIAEVVFTTAMTGYTETLTDPSYYGQMVVQTFPLIGNYGVNPKDFESKGIHMSAYITREWCPCPSNFRCQMDLDAFLKQQNVPGIYDLDTRYLTKLIRERGVMNGRLTSLRPDSAAVEDLKGWAITDAVAHVTCREPYQIPSPLPAITSFCGTSVQNRISSESARIKLRPDHRSRFHDSSTHPLLFAGRYHVEQRSRQPEG